VGGGSLCDSVREAGQWAEKEKVRRERKGVRKIGLYMKTLMVIL
jgi:hypothetical protein